MTRPQLQVLPGYGETDVEPYVDFCGHCGKRQEAAAPASRVCGNCHLGLIVSASGSLAPGAKEPFLIVDGRLQVCAVSRRAERLLGIAEADVVDRQLTDVLLPADAEAVGVEGFVSTIVHAARGDGIVRDLVVRPAGEWGIRWFTRIGPCATPSAVLIVLAPNG